MKKIYLLITFTLLALFSAKLVAQDCTMFFPSKEGTEMEYKNYEKADKILSSCKYKITKKEESGSDLKVFVDGEAFDKKGSSKGKFNFNAGCQGGQYYFDMKSYMASIGQRQNSTDVKIDATDLKMPSNPKPGDALNDGKLIVTMNSSTFPITSTILITNRKVDAIEDVTTPAGTFTCIKITSDIQVKMMFVDSKTKSIEWIAKGVGTVRSESYDKNGKLANFNLLTSITK